MDYDILKSVSQGSDGAQDAENSRIEAITDELCRRCELYEAQRGDSQPHVSPFEIDDIIYKVNNLLNSGSILRLFDKVRMHNTIFPDTFYQFHAFTGFDGRTIMPILKQDLVKNAQPTPQVQGN